MGKASEHSDQGAHAQLPTALRRARIKAGYTSAVEACRAFGWNYSTYVHHENGTRGQRGIPRGWAVRYSQAFPGLRLEEFLGLEHFGVVLAGDTSQSLARQPYFDATHARMSAEIRDARNKFTVGERLRLTREVLGVTQAAFAKEAKIKPPRYNQFETGTRLISIAEAQKLCDTYGLTLDWIYRGDAGGLRHDFGEAIKSLQKVRRR